MTFGFGARCCICAGAGVSAGPGALDNGFGVVFGVVGAVTTGGGGTGRAFPGTGAVSVPAGGFPPVGDVTTAGNFPPEGAPVTPVGGGATRRGATGAAVSGFPTSGDVTTPGSFPTGVVIGAPGGEVAAPGVTISGFLPNAGATGAPVGNFPPKVGATGAPVGSLT